MKFFRMILGMSGCLIAIVGITLQWIGGGILRFGDFVIDRMEE